MRQHQDGMTIVPKVTTVRSKHSIPFGAREINETALFLRPFLGGVYGKNKVYPRKGRLFLHKGLGRNNGRPEKALYHDPLKEIQQRSGGEGRRLPPAGAGASGRPA